MNNNVITFKGLYEAYCGCRRRKRRTQNAQRYEMRLLDNLYETLAALQNRSYSPHRSIRFVAQRPKAREIHAADFSDRVVHHWLVPRLEKLFEPVFIHDVYSNRIGKGTHKAVDRLQSFMHSVGNDGWFLQLDIANFFNSIDKPILFKLLQQRIRKAVKQHVDTVGWVDEADTLRWLCHVLLKHDASQNAIYRGRADLLKKVPPHKQLGNAGSHKGLPIGNLTSQFFANVYLNPLDQFVKHQLKCHHYLRYVDDFILLADNPETLLLWRGQIVEFLRDELQLKLKAPVGWVEQRETQHLPRRSVGVRHLALTCGLVEPRPVKSGADFLGYIVRPHYRLVRRRVVGNLREKLHNFQTKLVRGNAQYGYTLTLQTEVMAQLQATLASYRGHFKHANSYRLSQQITREFPWLSMVKDSQPSPLSVSYKRQQQFFRQRYPATDLHIQRGTEVDVLSPRIGRVKKQFVGWGEVTNPNNTAPNVGVHAVHPNLQRPTKASPISCVVVREQGHLKNGLKHTAPNVGVHAVHPNLQRLTKASPISCVVVREQGHLKNGLKHRVTYQLFIKPGVEICPTQRKKRR